MDLEDKREILLSELNRISSYKLLPDEYDGLEICMFSGGAVGRFAFQGLQWYFGDSLKYVCDNNISVFGGQSYKGKRVLSVDELVEIQEKCVVLIAASEKYAYDIARQLKDKGIKNIRIFNGDPVTRFMDVCFAKYAYNMLPKVWQILEDDLSKALLLERLSEIFYHLELPIHSYVSTPQVLIPPELKVSKIPLGDFFEPKQYFPEDIIHLTEKECFVDGGAYTGDTVASFVELVGNKFEKIYAFELEPNNYKKCKENLQGDDRIEVFPYGISDSEKEVFISLGKSDLTHRISSKGDNLARTVSLDKVLEKRRVTFIAMDIEGEELKALEGAKGIISGQKPTLAISAYHKASDIFDIPLWIKAMSADYKIYFRHHGNACLFDTVCYGIID